MVQGCRQADTCGAGVEWRPLRIAGRPNVGVIDDPGNVYLAGRPYAEAVAGPPAGHIVHVQCRDVDLERPTPAHVADEPALRLGGAFDLHLLLGEGKVDLRRAAAALRAIDYAGW